MIPDELAVALLLGVVGHAVALLSLLFRSGISPVALAAVLTALILLGSTLPEEDE